MTKGELAQGRFPFFVWPHFIVTNELVAAKVFRGGLYAG